MKRPSYAILRGPRQFLLPQLMLNHQKTSGWRWMFLVVLLLALHMPPTHAQGVSVSCKADALDQHNFLRANHQSPRMTWNDTLATAAQVCTMHGPTIEASVGLCVLFHIRKSGNDWVMVAAATKLAAQGCAAAPFAYDQNSLSFSTVYTYTSPCSTATLSWYAAGLKWTFSNSPIASNAALLNSADNMYAFTYVLWANTTQLGCGAAQGSTGCWAVVCRYSLAVPPPDNTAAAESAYFNNVKAPVVPEQLTSNDTCTSAVLGVYNIHRQEYQAPPKTWRTMMAIGAQGWANVLASQGCPAQPSGAGVEEDVQPWSDTPNTTVCMFLAEVAYRQASEYKFTSTPYADNQPIANSIGAFVRMVDKTNTNIGCGKAKGANGCWAGVCWFGPQQVWDDRLLTQMVGLPAAKPTNEQAQCQQAALTSLNVYRAQHGAPALTWNSSFAAVAEGLAVSAANTGCDISWLGSGNGVDGFTTVRSGANAVCDQAVDSFYSSGNKTFKFTSTPWADNKASFDQWHFFTQLIWQNTTQFGCGSAQGPDGCWVVICKYDPPGNTQSDEAYIDNVLPFGSPLRVRQSVATLSPAPGSNSTITSPIAGNTTLPPNEDSSSGSTKTTAIAIGVCVAAGIVFTAGAGFLFWHWRKRQQEQQQVEQENGTHVKEDPNMAHIIITDSTNPTGCTTTSTGPSNAATARRLSSQVSDRASGIAQVIDIPGLVVGDPFTRGTALAYSWNSLYTFVPGVTQVIEKGVNDLQLDALVQASRGQVQDCPVVCLSKEQVKQQLQLLTSGLRGRGGAALVFKALWPSRFGPDALVAVKVLKDGYDFNDYVLESFKHEASVLATVSHPNVVKLYGYCLDPPNVCLIMELLPCSLKEVLYGRKDITAAPSHQPGAGPSSTRTLPTLVSLGSQRSTHDMGKERSPLTMSQVLQVSTEIAAGLAYLHDQPEQGLKNTDNMVGSSEVTGPAAAEDVGEVVSSSQKIVHRDLKPANILINSLGQVKISDFGLARRHDSTTIETRHMGAGTVPYQAPEILSGSHTEAWGIKATNRCDVYSMAMMFWELLSRQPPWKDLGELAIMSQVVNGNRPELPVHGKVRAAEDSSLDLTQLPASLTALPAYNDIIRQCWAQRDWRRPTAAEAHRLLVELQQKYQAASAAAATVRIVISDDIGRGRTGQHSKLSSSPSSPLCG